MQYIHVSNLNIDGADLADYGIYLDRYNVIYNCTLTACESHNVRNGHYNKIINCTSSGAYYENFYQTDTSFVANCDASDSVIASGIFIHWNSAILNCTSFDNNVAA